MKYLIPICFLLISCATQKPDRSDFFKGQPEGIDSTAIMIDHANDVIIIEKKQ